MPEALSWTELVVLMVDVPEPEPTVRGAIRNLDGEDESRRYHFSFRSHGEPGPVHARHSAMAEDTYRVWRDGLKVRLEWPDGSPSLIVGDALCWRFPQPGRDGDVVESSADRVQYGGHGTELLWHKSGERLLGQYARRPLSAVEPTEFLGRPAWSVRVGPPSDKHFTSLWVVDSETGLLLRDYNELLHSVDEWVELAVGEPLDPALFIWEGTSVSEASVEDDRDARHERDMEARRQWFTANVAAQPLRFDVHLSALVNQWDDETGEFHATLGNGQASLARRRHSEEPWDVGASQEVHRWTEAGWDWAYYSWELDLTAEGLEELKRQLSG